MIIWCSDANGQLGREEDGEEQNTDRGNAMEKIDGQYAGEKRTEKGNRQQLRRIYQKHHMVTTATWENRGNPNKTGGEIANSERTWPMRYGHMK